MASKELEIPQIKRGIIKATIVGATPLLCNNPPVTIVPALLRKQCGLPKLEVEPPTMEELYERSIYFHPDPEIEYAFPAIGAKKAMQRSAGFAGVKMTQVKACVHTLGDWLPLRGTPQRLDTFERNWKKQMLGVVYAEFPEWEMDLVIRHITKVFTEESIINLLYNAGHLIGLGCRRPESGGTNGMFEIKSIQSEEQSVPLGYTGEDQ